MKLANKQLSRSAKSRTKKVRKKRPPKVDYYSELRDWVQHVILEAEKNKTSRRKTSS